MFSDVLFLFFSVEPLKASVTRVLECVVDNHGMMQWDSPQFSWLVDGVTVTNQTALLADGSRLDISEVKGVNYTCIIKSSLGTVTTHHQIPEGIVQCQERMAFFFILRGNCPM